MEKRLYTHTGTFNLECGGKLEDIQICYHISKDFDPYAPNSKKVIWITHALTANSDPTEWWDVLVGEGKYFDPRKYTVICANVIGSCYGSTSPTSINKETGRPYLLDFPKTTVRDIAQCHHLLLKHLGINYVDLIIGGSVGGCQAIEWSIMYPDTIKGMVLLACNHRFTPWGSAFNESQRMALFSDKTFSAQEYTITNNKVVTLGGKSGLAAARSIALISYRSYKGYNTTQYEKEQDCIFPHRAASYQQYQGKKLVDRFCPYSYLSLLNLPDSHNIGRGRNGVENALGMIKANTLCIGIDSDNLFPPQEQKYMAEHIPGARFTEITSAFGHDGFLLEWQQIKDAIEKENLI